MTNPTYRPPSYEDGQDIRDRSFDYACRVVGLCEELDEGGRIGCERRRIGSQKEVKALVQEGNELIAIVTTIIKKKRRNVMAKRESERAARAEAKRLRRDARRRGASASTHSKFQLPNS